MSLPAKQTVAASGDIMESVLLKGDLAKLEPTERVRYYNEVCKSIGLNPLTQPFAYITLNGKLTLYALRACTDQLRKVNSVSLEIVSKEVTDDILTVHVRAKLPDGRVDEDLGAVAFPATMKGEARANQELKCITKAKRRATLSICGLGWLDETEQDIPASAKRPAPPAPNVMLPAHDAETGEVVDAPETSPREVPASPAADPAGAAPSSNAPGGEVDSDEIALLDKVLADAAERGSEPLKISWGLIPAASKPVLKSALDRRHKVRAAEVDAAR